MKKLYTILSTIVIMFLSSSGVFATCEQSDNFWNTLQNGNYRFSYIHNDGTETFAGASDGVPVSINNIKAYKDITAFFDLNRLWKHINLTGVITLTSTVPNQLTTEYVVSNMSAPTLLYQLDDGSFVEWGSCQFTSINLSNISEFVVNSQTGTDRYSQQNINYSVQCYAGENPPANKIKALRFNLFKNQYNSSTSINANISLVHHINSDYQTFQGEYNNELCRIQELLSGIGSSTSSGVSSGDITQQTQDLINNNNSNTQSIINELNSQSCETVTCSNIININGGNGTTYQGLTYTVNNQSISISGTTLTTGNYNLTLGTNYNQEDYYLSGTYKMGINHAIPFDIEIAGITGCKILAGQTSTICSSNSNAYHRFRIKPGSNVVVNIQDLQLFMSSDTSVDFCEYGTTSQVCTGSNRLDNISNSISDVNDTLNNSDTSDASVTFEEFMENFDQSDYGFTDFVKLPITILQTINSATCSPLSLPIPFLTNRTIDLPCYQPYYVQYYGAVYYLTQTVYHAIIGYYCVYTIYKIIQDLLDPNNDKISIMDL